MQVRTNKTKYQDVDGTVVCMQVLYYDNTRFGTSNWLCMLLGIEVCNCCHTVFIGGEDTYLTS